MSGSEGSDLCAWYDDLLCDSESDHGYIKPPAIKWTPSFVEFFLQSAALELVGQIVKIACRPADGDDYMAPVRKILVLQQVSKLWKTTCQTQVVLDVACVRHCAPVLRHDPRWRSTTESKEAWSLLIDMAKHIREMIELSNLGITPPHEIREEVLSSESTLRLMMRHTPDGSPLARLLYNSCRGLMYSEKFKYELFLFAKIPKKVTWPRDLAVGEFFQPQRMTIAQFFAAHAQSSTR